MMPFFASERLAEATGSAMADMGGVYRAWHRGTTRNRAWVACRARIPAAEALQGTCSRSNLNTIESDSAWKEASTMLGDTPTVNQRLPLPSRLSTRTRVVAPVPPLRIRTL